MADGAPRLGEVLGEQVALLGLLVLFLGLGSTEAYYLQFGLRYQNLNLPLSHLVYRGLTILLGAWEILLLYAAAVVWLNLDVLMKRSRWKAFAQQSRAATYVVVLVLLAIGYPLARREGKQDAMRDLNPKSTRLSRVTSIVRGGRELLDANVDYRLLTADGTFVIYFAPVADASVASPLLIHLPTGAVDELHTAM